jgi:thymidylate kinase
LIDVLGEPAARARAQRETSVENAQIRGELVVLDRNVITSVARPDYRLVVDEREARGLP